MSEDVAMAGGDPVPHIKQSADGEVGTANVNIARDAPGAGGVDRAEDEDEDEDFSIKDVLKDAFASCASGFQGVYAALQTYSPAPNPYISIDGFGPLGLPLSPQEAGRLRIRCNPAAFGKGEQTVVDTSVRDTFELDAKHVQFLNPAWNSWLDTAIAKAVDALGVTGKQYRYELYKLLLYETGSHFKLHQDTEKSSGMFATAVIVLPTPHEGGAVRVKHGRQEKLLESGGQDIAATSVLSWYTDVHHEVKPVTKGFRLALAFNLIFSGTTQTVPRAPISDDVFQQVDDALRVWQARERAGESCPRRLIHILSHHYSQANVSFSHLKGVDSTLVTVLRTAAESRGFYVALGHLDYTVFGSADDDGGWTRRRRYDKSDWDEGDVTMAEVEDRGLSLQLISGTTGVGIGRREDIETRYDEDSDYGVDPDDEDDEVELLIDKSYWNKGGHDDQEYEGYQGNGAGSLSLFYHRTVVVFWPQSKNTSVVSSVGGFDDCVAYLKRCTSSRPTATDMGNVSWALTAGTPEISSIVADQALRWQNVEIWHDALKSCKGESNVHSLGMQRVQDALALFKFAGMRPVLDAVISETMSTKERLQFVDALEAHTESGTSVHLVPRDWVADKRRYVLSSLRTPKLEDVDSIVKVLTTLSDAKTLLCDAVLPQLKALNLTHDWWMAFTARLRASPGTTASLPDWESPVFEVAKLVFDKAVQQAPSNQFRFSLLDELEKAWTSHEAAASWIRQTRRWAVEHLTCPTSDDLNLVMNLVRTGSGFFASTLIPTLREMDYSDAFWPDLFTRLDLYSLEVGNALPDDWSKTVADALHTPLAKAQLQTTSNQRFFAALERISLAVPDHDLIKHVVQQYDRAALRALKFPTIEEVPLLVNKLQHDVECGSTLLIPHLRAYDIKLDFWESMVRTVHAQSDRFCQAGWSREQLRAFTGSLTSRAVASAELPPFIPPVAQPEPRVGYPYTPYASQPKPPAVVVSPIANDVKRLLVLCLLVDHTQLSTQLFQRIFTSYTTADAIKSVIVPLVPAILSVLQGNRTLAADTPPFDQFFRETVRTFITTVLGRKPDNRDTANWVNNLQFKCTCGDCALVKRMLATQNQVVWQASQARRNHVQYFSLAGIKELSVSTRQGGSGRMSSMVIDKIGEPGAEWSKRSAEAMQLLRSIGSDALIKDVYASVPGQLSIAVACIKGSASPSALTAAPFMSNTPSAASRAGNAPAASSHAVTASAPVAAIPIATAASGTPAASSSTAPVVAPSMPTIPKKRKAPPVDPKDVIEISDSD